MASLCLVRRIHAHASVSELLPNFTHFQREDGLGIFLSVHSCFMVNDVDATLIVDIGSCAFTAGFTVEDTICALFPSIVLGFRHHCQYGHGRVGVPAYSAMLGLRLYILSVSLRSSTWTLHGRGTCRCVSGCVIMKFRW